MAISAGGKTGGSMSEINMTPMIDVLLVLLVIFMLAQPLLQKSIDVQLPIEEEAPPENPAPQIVLEITADGNYYINTRPLPAAELESRLREIYSGRRDKVLFVKAHGDLIYQDVIVVMDAARGAGVTVLGAMLEDQPAPTATAPPT